MNTKPLQEGLIAPKVCNKIPEEIFHAMPCEAMKIILSVALTNRSTIAVGAHHRPSASNLPLHKAIKLSSPSPQTDTSTLAVVEQ